MAAVEADTVAHEGDLTEVSAATKVVKADPVKLFHAGTTSPCRYGVQTFSTTRTLARPTALSRRCFPPTERSSRSLCSARARHSQGGSSPHLRRATGMSPCRLHLPFSPPPAFAPDVR